MFLIFKFVLTGGPCAGKTTILEILKKELTLKGYYVFCCPEAATDLILNGIKISDKLSLEEFQNFVLEKQLANERLYEKLKDYYPSSKIIIFFDRGLMDQRAYMESEEKFSDLLFSHGINRYEALAHYDAVFHLVTAANGAEKYYQWNDPNSKNGCNNEARKESPEEAIESDNKTLNCWIGHPKLRIFDNSTDFKGKVQKVLKEIFLLVNEPVPKKIERKYLVKMPSAEDCLNLEILSETTIIQTYLKNYGYDGERRLRQRGTPSQGYSFYYSEKKNIGAIEKEEISRRISQDKYINLMIEADSELHQIIKQRKCFVYNNRQFDLDIFPFSQEYAILEVELSSPTEEVKLPKEIQMIKEVTDLPEYTNYSIAKNFAFPVNS